MRKNGINRNLTQIAGGVCAPDGFSAGGVYCGIRKKQDLVSRETNLQNLEDLGLITADKRCPVACVYAKDGVLGAPSKITQRHLKSGYARAILVNSGIANVYGDGAERSALEICRAYAGKALITPDEVAIASTGSVGERFSALPIIENITALRASLSADEKGSLACARAMMTTDATPKHFSYAFEIGDCVCKMGVVCKGSRRVCPNMATTLCFITTDVAITPQMLEKALRFSVGETLNMLDVDGISSPNDFACIMANGNAGNYKISEQGSDYEKFVYALTQTLWQAVMRIVSDGEDKGIFFCRVEGAKSKRLARLIAKKIVGTARIKSELAQGEIDAQSLLFALAGVGEDVRLDGVQLLASVNGCERVLYEDGRALATQDFKILQEQGAVTLTVRMQDANYSAKAVGVYG